VAGAVLYVAYRRLVGVEAAQCYIFRLENRWKSGGVPGVHQVAHYFGLTVDCHGLPRGRPFHVDPMPPPGEGNLDAIVNEALAVQAAGDPDFIQQIDSALFKNARADARQDIFPGLALDDYVVDAVLVEELSQEKAGGSASNDSNLCWQGRVPFYSSLAEIGFDDFLIFNFNTSSGWPSARDRP